MGFYAKRQCAKMSQAEVAKAIGVTSAAVCMWETGATTPRATTLPKIAKLYGCTIDELLSNEE